MSEPIPNGGASIGSLPELEDPGLHLRGRTFLLALYKVLRSVKLYPIENTQVRDSLTDMASAVSKILAVDAGLRLRIEGEILYVNEVAQRLDVDNFASFGYVITALSRAGIGALEVLGAPGPQEWKTFGTQLIRFELVEEQEHRVQAFQKLIVERAVKNIQVGPPHEGVVDSADDLERKQVARRTYRKSVSITKGLFDSARMGRAPRLKQVRHAVQGIIDQVLTNEVSMMGLSTLDNYDDYTFRHTVNVCIFSLAIGRRLGLNKSRLFDLGMAALLHDLGKSRVDIDLVMKEDELTEEEAERMQAHTWLGALSAFRLQDSGSAPLRGMITAYEHHMKVDFSGYPKARRPRELSVYSKIVALAAAYDNATLSRSDESPKTPDVALREIWEDERSGFDPVLVKALINVLGVYPVGTCVVLDTFEVGLVHAANSDASKVSRPIVRVLSNADGGWLDEPPLVDLAETLPDGSFARSIIKVTDPDRYLINVSHYFV